MYKCHCGFEEQWSDHCSYCMCEAYESTCDADYEAETAPLSGDEFLYALD